MRQLPSKLLTTSYLLNPSTPSHSQTSAHLHGKMYQAPVLKRPVLKRDGVQMGEMRRAQSRPPEPSMMSRPPPFAGLTRPSVEGFTNSLTN